MAKGRRYVRDNRGRFASTGATARGGRLRTAGGNKRATVTSKVKGAAPKGTVGKPRGLKPGAIKPKQQPKRGVNVSMQSMQRRQERVSDSAILARRQRADTWRDEMSYRSGQYPKAPKKRQDYMTRASQAEQNRRQNSMVTAQRARDFYASASFSASNFSLRPRYTTQQPPRNRPLPSMTSYFSAWRGYSYKPAKPRKP